MDKLLKKLIDDGALRYRDLVLAYYHKFGLSESEAMALIKLHTLLEEKQGVIKPEKFAKWLSLDVTETRQLLESLMEKGYLQITLRHCGNGKEQETFDVDHFLHKVTDHYNQAYAHEKAGTQHEWIAFLEDTLQHPLTPLDVDLVGAWIDKDHYSFEMVKEATFDALKRQHPSIRMIDRMLLKKVENVKTAPKRKKDMLKEFHALWDE